MEVEDRVGRRLPRLGPVTRVIPVERVEVRVMLAERLADHLEVRTVEREQRGVVRQLPLRRVPDLQAVHVDVVREGLRPAFGLERPAHVIGVLPRVKRARHAEVEDVDRLVLRLELEPHVPL